MKETRGLLEIIPGTILDLRQVVGYIYTFLSALLCSRATLAVRVLAAESQLAECKRRIEKKDQPRLRFTQAFKLLWVFLSRVWDPWHQVARLMQPATVKRWHTTAFRLYWRRKSSRQGGRPAVPQQMQDLKFAGSAERIPYGVPNESGIPCDFWAAIRRAATPSASTCSVPRSLTNR